MVEKRCPDMTLIYHLVLRLTLMPFVEYQSGGGGCLERKCVIWEYWEYLSK